MEWNDVFGESVEVKSTDKQADLDTLYARVFKSEAGMIVLNDLRAKTIEQPTWYPGEEASHGYAREGQNSIVRMIEERIKRARTI